MSRSDKTEISRVNIIRFLREIAKTMNHDYSNSWPNLEKAKLDAARLYVSHTNREINLAPDEFKLVISILEYK
ncbi:MAG: hypothetical protein IH840_05155 [Candidatus Heimdallarchaeota archaeon]|nr:hypothetical protein [Candidatus Heimdallarchaeota archaeon]